MKTVWVTDCTSARKQNAIKMFRRRADDSPTLNAGLVFQGNHTSIAKILWFFREDPDPLSPLLIRACKERGYHAK